MNQADATPWHPPASRRAASALRRQPPDSGSETAGKCGKIRRMKKKYETRTPIRDPKVMENMRMTFELYELAERMMEQKLRRENPGASDAEIEEGIRAWLRRRPGAELGDGPGVPSDRFDDLKGDG